MNRNGYGRILAAAILVIVSATSVLAGPRSFKAHLRGSNEVPAVETGAQGQIKLKLSKDGTTLHYRLVVANIENVTAAHLHLGVVGMNGPVVVSLFEGEPSGVTNGVLASGDITAEDLVGPLEGLTLDDLIDAIEDGDIYTNVHTEANPSGEIRGQIR